jgi:molybdopterin-guanine dinucleotide biosynthesis protein A
MPLIDAKSVQKIYAVYRQHPEKITVASYQGYRQPLFGIYPKSVGPLLEQMIAEGRYRMKDLLTMAEAVEVPFEENDKIMININTPAEYQQLKGGETVCFNWKKPETY